MKKIFKNIPSSWKWVTLFLTIVAISLIIGSFFVPPLGVIDSSIIAATGEIFGFSALWVFAGAIEKGYDATIKRGETEVTLTDDEKK